MRIALDGRTLQSRPLGGIGRVLRAVLPELAAAARAAGLDVTGLDVLTDPRLPRPDGCPPPDVDVHAVRSPVPGGGPVWLQQAAPRWLATTGRGRDVRLFHCPFYGLPRRQPVPMVVSMYDLTFLDHPEWFRPLSRLAFRAQARLAARTARAVITGSTVVAGSIAERFAVDPRRVFVAAPSVDDVFLAAGRDHRDGDERHACRRSYVVAMGGAPRRNLAVAVEAWRAAVRAGADVDLLVVGPTTPTERRAVGAGEGMVLTGALPDHELAGVLSRAVAFAYPTAHEGFGLPAAEAAAAGTPVICAPVGALPEVLGPAAEWCDPSPSGPAVEAVAGAILRLVNDPDRAACIRRDALDRIAAAPGPADAARQWARAYALALGA